jgi:hypothetical protein
MNIAKYKIANNIYNKIFLPFAENEAFFLRSLMAYRSWLIAAVANSPVRDELSGAGKVLLANNEAFMTELKSKTKTSSLREK